MVDDGSPDQFYWHFADRYYLECEWGDCAAVWSYYFRWFPWWNWAWWVWHFDEWYDAPPEVFSGPWPGWDDQADMSFRLRGIPKIECRGDLNGDGDIGLSDLAMLLASYGATSRVTYWDGDIDLDGDVDLSDLAALLAVYGTSCP